MTHFKMSPSNRAMGRQKFEPKHNATKQEQLSIMNTAQLARITGTSKSTWEQMRTRGEGPQYIKVRNLVWYRWSDLQIWLAAHQVETRGDM